MANKKDNEFVRQLLPFLIADRLFWNNLIKDNSALRQSHMVILLACYHLSESNIISLSRINSLYNGIDRAYFSKVMRLLAYSGYITRLSEYKYMITDKGINFCLDYINKVKSNLELVVK